MPYTIPNELDAGFADQAELDSRDIAILAAGFSDGAGGSDYGIGPTGVESGAAVTAQGTPDMTVAVAAGIARIGGRRVVVATGNVTITTANGTNPRFDLIVVDTAGIKTAIAGTAAANASFPAITAGKVVLAAVYVPANDTAINTNQITDKRVMVDQPLAENVKWYGALGSGSGNDQPAIQAAMDAAELRADTGGKAWVFVPPSIGKYRVTAQITWKQRVSVIGHAAILYAGSTLTDGVIITESTGAQNQQFDVWDGVGVEGGTAGNVLADYGIRVIEGSGKTDFGMVVQNCGQQYFNKSGLRFEAGATNLHIRRMRWDHCGEYAIDVTRSATAAKTLDLITVEEFTWDNNSAPGVPKGFIRIDQTEQDANDTAAHIKIQNGRVENNKTVSTTTTSALTLPQATIAVTSTTGFATAGKVAITLTSGDKQIVSYTGVTGTTLTGATGGVGAYSTSAAVVQVGEGVVNLVQPTTDPGGKMTHYVLLDNVWVASPVAIGDTFPIVRIRKSDGTAGDASLVTAMALDLDPRTHKLIETADNDNVSIGAQRSVPFWAWSIYNGSPTNAQAPVQWMAPVWWREVPVPATPPAKYHAFYVDPADSLLKSKNSAGTITVYGSRTRSLFIDASVFRMDASTGVKLGAPPNAVDGVQLADGVTSGAYCNFIMPVDVTAGLVTVCPVWVPNSTDGVAHTVRWQMNIRIISAADVTAAGTSVAWTGASATRTVNVEVLEPGQASTGVSPAANDRVRLAVQRVGGDGADTYVGAVNLIGLRLDYLANN